MMNSTIKQYGIFYKDCKLLLRMAFVIFIIQLASMVIVPILFELGSRIPNFIEKMPARDYFPKMQIAMSIIFSLIAAGHWWAEERGAKTDWLLRRLPISSWQLWTEKTLAGMFCVFLFFIVQLIWYAFLQNAGDLFGIKIDDPFFEYIFILFNVTVYAYFIGLPFSYRLNHTIGVIVIGIAMFMPGMWIASILQSDPAYDEFRFLPYMGILYGLRYLVSILPQLLAFSVPFCLYLYFSCKYIKPNPRVIKAFWVLVHKQYREMRVYFIAAILILIFSFISIFSAGLMILGIMLCVIITASLLSGITSYTNEEKGGLHCVLYHHPIPLSHVYWSKIIPSLGIAVILASAFVIVLLQILDIADNPVIKNLFSLHPENNINVIPQPYYIYFVPIIVMMFFVGLLPYAVGVLMSHIVPNTIYAFLESVPFVVAAVFCYLFLQYSSDNGVREIIMYSQDRHFLPIPSIPWILIVLSGLMLVAGWRAATDRRLLTATIFQRQLYITRLFLVTIALTVLFFRIGIWDSLYLITGIDLGIG